MEEYLRGLNYNFEVLGIDIADRDLRSIAERLERHLASAASVEP